MLFLTVVARLCLVCSADSKAIYSWHNNTNNIALTFDDGPHPKYTAEILEILAEYDIKATFFTVGENATWFPDLIRAEYEQGHEIGNHTFTHKFMKNLKYHDMVSEIEKCEKAIYENIEIKTHLLRPPGGKMNESVFEAARKNDYKVICWSIDTHDWSHTPTKKIIENVLSSVKGGDIILFHDYIIGESPTPDALRIIIPVLLDEGYNFVTVSELLES